MVSNNKIHWVFIKLTLIFGLILIFLMPPLQMPDEEEHIKKIYCISSFDFYPIEVDGALGNYIPKAMIEFANSNGRLTHTSEPYTFTQQYLQDEIDIDSWKEYVFEPHYFANVNSIMYMPQVIGVWLTKIIYSMPLFGGVSAMTPIHYMYAARLGNLMCFILLGALSLKYTPIFKRVMFALLLMPMTLTLAISTGYDMIVIGISYLSISVLLMYVYKEKKIDEKKLAILLMLCVMLIQLKQVYFPIIMILVLVNNEAFSRVNVKWLKNKYIVLIVLGIISGMIYLIMAGISGGIAPSSLEATGYPQQQIKFILHNPIEYVKIFFNTFSNMRKFYLTTTVGVLGNLDINFPYILIVMYVVYLIILSLFDSNGIHVKIIHKLTYIGITLISIVLIQTSLYIIWTSLPEIGGIGYSIISGVQGRYYIPILMLGLLIFSNTYLLRKKTKIEAVIDNIYIPIAIFYGSYTCIITLLSYRI